MMSAIDNLTDNGNKAGGKVGYGTTLRKCSKDIEAFYLLHSYKGEAIMASFRKLIDNYEQRRP